MNPNMSSLTRRLARVLVPLSRREQDRAINAALKHFFAQSELGAETRFRVIGAELRLEKPPKRGAVPKRLIQVFVVDYANRKSLGITVGTNGKVAKSQVLCFQPTFHEDEIADARKLAESEERVGRIARRRRAFVNTFTPHEATMGGNRMIGLRYLGPLRGARGRILATVIVDLNDERVVSFRRADPESDASDRTESEARDSYGKLG
jgi:hypothetical protein